MKEKLHYILLLITVLLVAGISLANMQSVNVSFILFSFKLPLIILILISVLLGSITTFLISMVKNFSLKKELKKTKEVLENHIEKTRLEITPAYFFVFSFDKGRKSKLVLSPLGQSVERKECGRLVAESLGKSQEA